MFAPSSSSMSPFLHDRMVLRPMNTPLPMVMPRLVSPLASSRQLSSIDDVVADADLVRMAQHDVLAEDDVAAAGAEQRRVERLAQREPERAGHALRGERDELVPDERAPAGAPDDQRDVLLARRLAPVEQLVLRAGDLSHATAVHWKREPLHKSRARRPTGKARRLDLSNSKAEQRRSPGCPARNTDGARSSGLMVRHETRSHASPRGVTSATATRSADTTRASGESPRAVRPAARSRARRGRG